MDMKRFTEITWQEAVVKWSNGEHVFSSTGHTYYMKDDALYFFFGSESNGAESTAFFNDITQKTWYIKKPFDVRAEMLARPNEWVGAYKDENERWHRVAFDVKHMRAVETPFITVVKVSFDSPATGPANSEELEKSIPIEDVPKGEFT